MDSTPSPREQELLGQVEALNKYCRFLENRVEARTRELKLAQDRMAKLQQQEAVGPTSKPLSLMEIMRRLPMATVRAMAAAAAEFHRNLVHPGPGRE